MDSILFPEIVSTKEISPRSLHIVRLSFLYALHLTWIDKHFENSSFILFGKSALRAVKGKLITYSC